MTRIVLLYYITDRSQFPGNESDRRHHLLEKIGEAARAGVNYIQLREKDLSSRELVELARAAVQSVQENSLAGTTRLLINSRTDIALAVGAEGVHLPSGDLSPSEVRAIWKKAGGRTHPIITISCHSQSEVAQAANAADLAIFAPVFEKPGAEPAKPTGLDALQAACTQAIPVIALGGITLQNAAQCLKAGAAGIAAIRLFQQDDADHVVATLTSKTYS